MEALVLAGGRADPALQRRAGAPGELRTALLPFAGRPLLQRVLDACSDARAVDHVVVVGLEEADADGVDVAPGTHFVADAGTLVGNLAAGAAALALTRPPEAAFLVVSCDLPYLTGAMLDWVCAAADPALDYCYTVVPEAAMAARFPGARRTYHRMRDGRYCGGDVQILSLRLRGRLNQFASRLVAGRKSPRRLARLFGPVFLLRFIAGRMTHAEVAQRIERRLGVRGRIVVSPFAELGMDLDTSEHWDAALAAGAPADGTR